MNRHFLSLVAALILAAPAAHAQVADGMHHEHADSAEHARMMAKLNLTDAQKAQIKAIHEKYHAQMKDAHKQSGMAGTDSMHDMHDMLDMHDMDTTMKKAMAEVRAVLTPAQQKQFDAMMAEHSKKREVSP